MSQENVEAARACCKAGTDLDLERALGWIDGEIEYDLSHFPEGRVYRGHAGFREAFRQWLSPFDDYRQEWAEFLDAGDEVVVIGRERGRGKTSEIEVDQEVFAVWTMRNEKAVRIRFFQSRPEALEAAGLSE